jgi:hypothetical protein
MRVTTAEYTFWKDRLPIKLEFVKQLVKNRMFYMVILSFSAMCLSFVYGSVSMAQEGVKIFSLQPPGQSLETPLPELNNSLIYGISWRFRWNTIEPKEELYNWELIDRAVEITTKAGKKVMLRIVAGRNTPEWVYRAGARPFDFKNTDLAYPANHKPDMRMPIPWDEIYLERWERFIKAFGKRYNGNPNIYSIQMSGGGHIGEMNLPKAHDKWQQAGYSDEKLISAWKRIIDAYQKAFPNTPTNLNINEPLGKKRSNVLEPVVAYVLSKYPNKVYLQQDGLRADMPKDNHIRLIIREASKRTIVGYQMLWGKGALDRQTGDRMMAFRNAIEDNVSYVEVYTSDVRDAGLRGALQFLGSQK